MTKQQWLKRFKRALSSLPREECTAAVQYYNELYEDKRENGESEADILEEFGLPESAAAGISGEREKGKPTERPSASASAARIIGAICVFIFIGIPVLAVLFSLMVSAAAIAVSGIPICLAGVADCVWFIIALAKGTEIAAMAHIGIGAAAAGAGLLLIPCFLYCAKALWFLCKKSLVLMGRMLTGKRGI